MSHLCDLIAIHLVATRVLAQCAILCSSQSASTIRRLPHYGTSFPLGFSLVILVGSAVESASSLCTTTTSTTVARGLSGPTFANVREPLFTVRETSSRTT